MRYEKPSINLLIEAGKAIRSGVKGIPIQTDSVDPKLAMTNGAYEADE